MLVEAQVMLFKSAEMKVFQVFFLMSLQAYVNFSTMIEMDAIYYRAASGNGISF